MEGENLEKRERNFLRKRERGTGERVWRCRASQSPI